jgi:uncharacterized protein YbaA (DUF1428 family)
MSYVDGIIVAVPTINKEAYEQQAKRVGAIFKDAGATRVVDCWGHDLPKGKSTDFWMAVTAEPNEMIVFSWIEWPSKAVRDAGMKRAMERMRDLPAMPFDGKRAIFGGFIPIADTAT